MQADPQDKLGKDTDGDFLFSDISLQLHRTRETTNLRTSLPLSPPPTEGTYGSNWDLSIHFLRSSTSLTSILQYFFLQEERW